jgi:hypothetical protein
MRILSFLVIFTIVFLTWLLWFAPRVPAQATKDPSAQTAPVLTQRVDLPVAARVLLLEQEVAELRAELDHVHKVDMEWSHKWIVFLYEEVVKLEGVQAIPRHREGKEKL